MTEIRLFLAVYARRIIKVFLLTLVFLALKKGCFHEDLP